MPLSSQSMFAERNSPVIKRKNVEKNEETLEIKSVRQAIEWIADQVLNLPYTQSVDAFELKFLSDLLIENKNTFSGEFTKITCFEKIEGNFHLDSRSLEFNAALHCAALMGRAHHDATLTNSAEEILKSLGLRDPDKTEYLNQLQQEARKKKIMDVNEFMENRLNKFNRVEKIREQIPISNPSNKL